MNHSPQKNKLPIAVVLSVCIAAVVLSIAVCKVFDLQDAIWQGVFFISAYVICDFSVKRFIPKYVYSIDNSSFVITKTIGKKTSTVCNIDTGNIDTVIELSEYKKQEEHKVKNMYRYSTNLFGSSYYVLVFNYNGYKEGVIFEPNSSMIEFILSVKENR